jgi:hypothetical protein
MISGLLSKLQKDDGAPALPPPPPPRRFDNRSIAFGCNDGMYTKAQALKDFGNLTSGWNESRAHITTQQCQIKLCKDALSASGGMIAKYDVAPGSEYTTTFKVKFHADFEWCTGGKFGPGFFIGDGAAGGSGCNGRGGSARMVWHKHRRTGEVFFQVYAYHAGQTDKYGNSFGRFPSEGSSLDTNQWYDTTIYVKSNTGCNTDGWLRVTVNGQNICDQNMQWTSDDQKRLVNRMEFATFRGGATEDYMSAHDSYIYYKDLTWQRLAG